MKCCIDCKHFRDAHYSKTYISPQCTQRGTDSAAYMRAFVCGVDEALLYEPKPLTNLTESENHAIQFKN